MHEIRQKLDGVLRGLVQDSDLTAKGLDELDSIELMELSMAIELHFGVSLTGLEISDLGDLNALETAIRGQIKN